MDNGAVRRLQTNNTGRYRAPLLPLGRYEISAERAGFRPGVRSSILLQIGQTLTVNFILTRAATPAVTEVSAPAALLEPDRKQPGTTIDLRFLDNLPLFGRKFMDLGVMVPGATEFGQRDTSATGDFGGVNHFYSNSMVDGTYSYQAWSGLPNGKFLVPFEYSQNAIREFQILNGNFTAEFGRSAGGLINVVTKSGTNQMHGDASYLFSDSSMNATPRFALRKPKTRQQEFAGSLGGPLVADKLFLFGNYDQQPRREPMIVIPGTVLDGFDGTLASITNPDEQQRFIHAGEFVRSLLGSLERNSNQYTFLTRADWRPTSKHSVSARFNYQKFHATNFPENGFAEPIVSGLAVSNNGKVGVENNSLAMQWSVEISPQTLNEARLQFALGNESQVANSDGPQVLIGSATAGITFGRRDVFPSYLREQRWQFVDNVTFIRGRHEIKAGADVDRVSDRNSFLPASSGSYQFNNLRDFANGRYLT